MDTCEEILVTITRNKTRSLLTAFGVFWGIFMLVALIGGGQGMQEQMKAQFEGFATNSGFIAAQKTSEAYKGFRKGRWWDLEMEDVERVRSIDGIKTATPSFADVYKRQPLHTGRQRAGQSVRYGCECHLYAE